MPDTPPIVCPKRCDVATPPEPQDDGSYVCSACGTVFRIDRPVTPRRQARQLARQLAWHRRADPRSTIVRDLIVAIDALVGTLERRGVQVALAWPWEIAALAGMPGLRARGEV